MSKSNDKKTKRKNGAIINKVADLFNVSTRYVRMCLDNDRHGKTAELIVKQYNVLNKELQEIMKINKPTV
jgi:hypothetical protein